MSDNTVNKKFQLLCFANSSFCSLKTYFSSSLTVPQLWDPPPPRFSSPFRLLKQLLSSRFRQNHQQNILDGTYKSIIPMLVPTSEKKSTYDRSLPLCLSNSRFPLESKPSLRPIPRPLPPRAPLPPPRPLTGLSPTGLQIKDRVCIIK